MPVPGKRDRVPPSWTGRSLRVLAAEVRVLVVASAFMSRIRCYDALGWESWLLPFHPTHLYSRHPLLVASFELGHAARFPDTTPFGRCGTLLRKFECWRQFPVCEFGREYNLLCESACATVIDACATEGIQLTRAELSCVPETPAAADLSDGFHCVDLFYSGALRTGYHCLFWRSLTRSSRLRSVPSAALAGSAVHSCLLVWYDAMPCRGCLSIQGLTRACGSSASSSASCSPSWRPWASTCRSCRLGSTPPTCRRRPRSGNQLRLACVVALSLDWRGW